MLYCTKHPAAFKQWVDAQFDPSVTFRDLEWVRANWNGKIILKGTMARFARSFALSSTSGVPIVQALTVVSQTVDNAYLCARVEQMRDGVERGDSILRTSVAAGRTEKAQAILQASLLATTLTAPWFAWG